MLWGNRLVLTFYTSSPADSKLIPTQTAPTAGRKEKHQQPQQTNTLKLTSPASSKKQNHLPIQAGLHLELPLADWVPGAEVETLPPIGRRGAITKDKRDRNHKGRTGKRPKQVSIALRVHASSSFVHEIKQEQQATTDAQDMKQKVSTAYFLFFFHHSKTLCARFRPVVLYGTYLVRNR